ncbi:hypothetical protein I7I50_09028 [Histoplasma capsulatum G186AR]|uniref:Uncharacterized protein n=1 Tax=Ajellomyces capsulatus TaxID=5037 RepID=A0A8H8D156_AJECA|nr:hypothetical protein I7I52_06543 [Histoplasma capsulatum]QSS74041.1 hypothetical protein I7I50_09028 [Histoplasma capsulatum G186AR]
MNCINYIDNINDLICNIDNFCLDNISVTIFQIRIIFDIILIINHINSLLKLYIISYVLYISHTSSDISDIVILLYLD